MLHLFRCLGRRFLLDVESGSVMQLDEVAFEAFDARIKDTGSFLVKNSEIEAEIEGLKRRGLIDTPPNVHTKRKWDGAIKAMCLNVSHECNLACGYCFANDIIVTQNEKCKRNDEDEVFNMSAELAVKAIDFLAENSGDRRNLEVDFFGGEPLLNMPAVLAAVARGRELERNLDKTFRFTLTTNGSLLTDEIIDFINLEISNVVISIDGRKEVHNAVRKIRTTQNEEQKIKNDGSGSYDLIVERVKKLVKKRVIAGSKTTEQSNEQNTDYYIRGTYTNKNTDFVEDVLWLYGEGFKNLSLEPVVLPEGHSLALRDEDVEACLIEYEKLAKEVVEKGINFFHFNVDLAGGPCESKRLTACGAGYEYVAVDPKGDVYPCHQFVGQEQYRLGNITQKIKCKTKDNSSHQNAGRDLLNGDRMETFSRMSLLDKPECTECWAKYYCGGGCMANAVMCGAGENGVHKQSCELMKKRIECGIALWAFKNEK